MGNLLYVNFTSINVYKYIELEVTKKEVREMFKEQSMYFCNVYRKGILKPQNTVGCKQKLFIFLQLLPSNILSQLSLTLSLITS